jgi:hypothetical protein
VGHKPDLHGISSTARLLTEPPAPAPAVEVTNTAKRVGGTDMRLVTQSGRWAGYRDTANQHLKLSRVDAPPKVGSEAALCASTKLTELRRICQLLAAQPYEGPFSISASKMKQRRLLKRRRAAIVLPCETPVC